LRQGKLDRFSLDMLVRLLHRAGADAHVHIARDRTVPACGAIRAAPAPVLSPNGCEARDRDRRRQR
jgi:hypothetical protein